MLRCFWNKIILWRHSYLMQSNLDLQGSYLNCLPKSRRSPWLVTNGLTVKVRNNESTKQLNCDAEQWDCETTRLQNKPTKSDAKPRKRDAKQQDWETTKQHKSDAKQRKYNFKQRSCDSNQQDCETKRIRNIERAMWNYERARRNSETRKQRNCKTTKGRCAIRKRAMRDYEHTKVLTYKRVMRKSEVLISEIAKERDGPIRTPYFGDYIITILLIC